MKTPNYFSLPLLLNSKKYYFLLFVLCVISRLFTSINYLEDIDSMRFALSLFDYNILDLRPHFPGYPVFCFFAKIIYLIIGSVQFTFSIIGGISIFIIIYYSDLLFKLLMGKTSHYLSMLLFISPLLWNLGNRYMSDLFGLSLLVMVIYYLLIYINTKNTKQLFVGFFVFGLLAGVRVSFLPFLIPIFFYVLFILPKKNVLQSLFVLFFGILIWIIPLILISGLDDLYNISINHISGHFYKWGGSILTNESSYLFRFQKIIESIWADGLGGWWKGRNIITLFVSMGWILSFCFSLLNIHKFKKCKSRKLIFLLIISIIFYFIWIFLFQNIIYKPRHVIPFIPFALIISSIGISTMIKTHKIFKIFIYTFFCCLFALTSYLNWQHKSPSAISQVKSYIIEDESDLKIFCSSNLINTYMKKHKNSDKIVFLNMKSFDRIKKYYDSGYSIYSTKNLNHLKMNLEFKGVFYHNPYVNRLWSSMRIYKYKNEK
tara:strand:+ start:952 stop:2415 length:1464 start_codon:yes stop_codon:yes gene_type:complete